MELYKQVFLWFSVCVTSISTVIKVPSGGAPSRIDVPNFLNSGYDLYKAYESATNLETEYEWSISAQNLPELDSAGVYSKSGPMCITYIRSRNSDSWVEYHKTDLVWKKKPSTNAEFAKKISIPQKLRGEYSVKFELRNVSINDDKIIYWNHVLGYAESDLKEIMRSAKTVLPLKGENLEDHKKAFLSIHSEKLVDNYDLVILKLTGIQLDNTDQRESPSPYIQIYKRTEEDEYVLTWRTKVIYDSSNPEWPLIRIPIKNLCNGDYERPLKFVCTDFVEDGDDNVIGEFETTLNYMADHTNRTFTLRNPKKERRIGQINMEFEVIKLPSFANFIKNGLRLQFTVAIDFTGADSNHERLPDDSMSDSRDGDGTLDAEIPTYEKALATISALIEDFDWDRKLLLLAYGLRNHADYSYFVEGSENDNSNSVECVGSQGIIDAYHKILSTAELSESSFLAPVIRRFAHAAEISGRGGEYSILIILTDGFISDLDETKEALVEVSKLRAIVLILGIGDTPVFEDIKKLIADSEISAEDCGGNVHLIEFNKFVSFHADDIRLYLGRELFLTRRDPLRN